MPREIPKEIPKFGAEWERAQRQEVKAPATPTPAPPDPLAGMPRLPSPFDIPEVADFAEGVFGRSPLGMLRDLAAKATGGAVPTQAEKTADAERRSPVATGAGRVFNDVVASNALLKPLGMFGAGAAPEVINTVFNDRPSNLAEAGQAGVRAGLAGLGSKLAYDPSGMLRTALKYSPTSNIISKVGGMLPGMPTAATNWLKKGLASHVPSIPGLGEHVAPALPAGLLEWGTVKSDKRETDAYENRKWREGLKKGR